MRNIVFHRERCLACWNCELACSTIHSRGGPPPRRRITMAAGADGVEALRCEQCREPLCAFTCKSGAIRRDPLTGRTTLDENFCVGCFMCLMVCPHGVRPDPAVDRVVRCDVCEGLDTPACVSACPTGALGAEAAVDRRVRSEFSGRVVVVGSSAAGIAACEAAREFAPACSITLVTADNSEEYSRPLLPYALAGRIERTGLSWRTSTHLDAELRGRRAVGLKSDAGPLVLDNGDEIPFDRLIVATGARAATLAGACALRDLGDLEQIERLAGPGRRAVVLGGGNVGLQAAEALLVRGMEVTVVVASSHLLSQMVDAEAGRRVAELFVRHGLKVRTGRDVVEIAACQVRLDDGECLDADIVVVGKGIQPNVEWLAGSGVRVGRGIVTDLCGRTSVPGIFAAGDCAETTDPLTGRSSISGIWPVAYETGRAAGAAAVGVERPSAGALRMNASRFFEVPVISIGEVRPERLAGATAEILANREGVYRKLVHHQGRLVGALLYGDISGAGSFYREYRTYSRNELVHV
jgi:NAD(P)H-nitrite reductase large subunit/Pyruvate/2-oxoacid:ferredoxin oxidoreductase delta subunit